MERAGYNWGVKTVWVLHPYALPGHKMPNGSPLPSPAFIFFTVLATEHQCLPGICRKVTFPKKYN